MISKTYTQKDKLKSEAVLVTPYQDIFDRIVNLIVVNQELTMPEQSIFYAQDQDKSLQPIEDKVNAYV